MPFLPAKEYGSDPERLGPTCVVNAVNWKIGRMGPSDAEKIQKTVK